MGIPQGCVLSTLLYSLYMHNCVARNSSNTIIKFADDTIVLDWSANDEKAFIKNLT